MADAGLPEGKATGAISRDLEVARRLEALYDLTSDELRKEWRRLYYYGRQWVNCRVRSTRRYLFHQIGGTPGKRRQVRSRGYRAAQCGPRPVDFVMASGILGNNRQRRGFTLVEMLVALVLLSLVFLLLTGGLRCQKSSQGSHWGRGCRSHTEFSRELISPGATRLVAR